MKKHDCRYEMRILNKSDFADLYKPECSNALYKKRKELDVLGVGAHDGSKLIRLAMCSTSCVSMWQIGIDVLPECRRMGSPSALTSSLFIEILERSKVQFYCVAWSNIKYVGNAIKSGFRLAWIEMSK